jgi:hypothetical protein
MCSVHILNVLPKQQLIVESFLLLNQTPQCLASTPSTNLAFSGQKAKKHGAIADAYVDRALERLAGDGGQPFVAHQGHCSIICIEGA